MEKVDIDAFVVINATQATIAGTFSSEAAAKQAAEEFAETNAPNAFIVYQKIGSAQLQPRVVWKGVSR